MSKASVSPDVAAGRPCMSRKLLFVVNVDWFFLSHRLPIALEAMRQGYEVHLATGLTDKFRVKVNVVFFKSSEVVLLSTLIKNW